MLVLIKLSIILKLKVNNINYAEIDGYLIINERRIYPFNQGLRIYGGVYHPPFNTLKIGISTDDIKLKLYR